MITIKDVIFYFCCKYVGNWDKVYKAFKDKEEFKEEFFAEYKEKYDFNSFISMADDEYPVSLKEATRPPFGLFFKGDISLLKTPLKNMISVIGSRKCTPYGENTTKDIISKLDEERVIISGLAKGIDVVAHTAALDSGLATIAVLGSGINNCYPRAHQPVYNKILANGGLILSEYPGDTEPLPEYFIHRNRIVASLCTFLLVSESYGKTGTYSTVCFALGSGKDVGCVPYEANLNSNCNKMIKEGAYLIESASDIINVIENK
ncbi:MAG TPA: DNA-processing protein DprA [Candidatus Onthovivens sp.]|nr:DNA-processing protein DprA [Candidatus Onthovivens sp.]